MALLLTFYMTILPFPWPRFPNLYKEGVGLGSMVPWPSSGLQWEDPRRKRIGCSIYYYKQSSCDFICCMCIELFL